MLKFLKDGHWLVWFVSAPQHQPEADELNGLMDIDWSTKGQISTVSGHSRSCVRAANLPGARDEIQTTLTKQTWSLLFGGSSF